jgi:hypothetical protein
MKNDRKRYNVWLAYSDLFTNLSAFLFISALGVFAALGAGRSPALGVGQVGPCKVPASLETAVKHKDSVLAPLGSAAIGKYPCEINYQISGYRYQSFASDIGFFRSDDSGKSAPVDDIENRVCKPIWMALGTIDFNVRGGSVILRSVASENSGWRNAPHCSGNAKPPPVADFDDKDPLQVISDCQHNAKSYPAYCPLVDNCLHDKDDGKATATCDQITAVINWNIRHTRECLAKPAQAQAAAVSKICEDYRTKKRTQFPVKYLRDSTTMIKDAETRDLWSEVRTDAYIAGGDQGSAVPGQQPSPLEGLSAGTVVVTFQFKR